ncbi:ATP-binding protein [uncultured Imperialibacter sp.]|uniref:hybrid sensor histidine kinase/response regulator transcription factor n=1 Tax=uncultured Imperialibacter sp. TaxID=1672639 RepID=UPI0030DB249C|tara:strand:+ start:12249 stop:16250 length:4002 start_codon:yes stop_codon:yes gene_type:complete
MLFLKRKTGQATNPTNVLKHCLLILTLLFCGATRLPAQQPLFVNYQKFDPENGLPQSYVTGIVQDSIGFLWISTLDGLVRYDGSSFQTLRQLSSDTVGLSSNRIHRMLLDKNGQLVIKHVVGPVDYLNPKTFSIKRAIEPNAIYSADNMGTHWRNLEELMHDGNANWLHVSLNESFEIMDSTSNGLATYSKVLYEREKFDFYSFRITPSGMLYLLTPEGLKIYESPNALPETISLPLKVDLSASIRKRPTLFGKGDNDLLIGCKEGLLHFNNISKEFDLIQIEVAHLVNAFPTYLITEDRLGRPIFVFQRQVYRLEPNNQVSWLWKNPGSFDISALFVDRTNTLWIGMDADGLYKVNLELPGFTSYLYSDNFVTDVLEREVKVSKDHVASLGYDKVTPYYFRYYYLDSETLVFGVENSPNTPGIFKLNAGSITPFYNPKFLPDAFTLSPDNDLYLVDSVASIFHFKPVDQSLTKLKSNVPDGAHNIVVDLLADEKFLWVGTSIGGIYQIRNGEVVQHIKPNGKHSINTVRFDERNPDYLWIGTLGGGLLKWSKSQNKLLASYTTNNGLPNNTINCIVPDNLGNIWMSTNIGVSRFNPETERITNYTKADGLVETEFNRHHQMLLPDGRIAMGGTNGYSVFDPRTFVADTSNTQVILSALFINDQPVLAGNRSPFSAAMLDELILPYDSNTISFEFAPVQYNAPEKNKLRYQLVGFDQNWVEIGNERKFRFAQLPHGKYTLRVVSTNTSDIWSEHVKEVKVTILPPPWRTWWAYLSYALLALLIIRAIWQVYKNRLREKQEAEFNLREAARLREMDELKTRFFSNVTHEFRTPLTLILSPLEKQLADPGVSPSIKPLLDNNYRHARQLLNLVNQLLDISKIEGKQMPVSNSTGDLNQFVEACVGAFHAEALSKGIDLTFRTSATEGYFLFDSGKWENIIYNLLGNAIKFISPGKKNAKVMLTLGPASQQDFVELCIEDTGLGIAHDQLDHIFERFYQVDGSSTRQHEGTGIGLALVKELVDLLEGTIKVESQLGKGTAFTLVLPAQKISESAYQLPTNTSPVKKETTMADSGDREEPVSMPVLLVVEDNAELRSFIKEGLSSHGHILEANNGKSAWNLLINELPDIVISDVMMPQMNGFELCQLSKQDPRTAHINFILLTAKASQSAKIEGLESGADEYLTKPFNMKELELRVKNLLQEQSNLRKYLLDKVFPKSPESGVDHVDDVFVKQLQKSLDEKLDDTSLNVEALAETVSMSKSSLNRKLKAILNISTKDFIKQYRLKKATTLLLAGHPVSQVSYIVGFDTPSYFGQCFKEQFHLTPSEFVKAHKSQKLR